MKLLHRVTMALTAFLLSSALACTAAYACKADYCGGSQAPTNLSQVGGAQNYKQGGGGGNASGLKWPCTSMGTDEQAQALSLLQSGLDVCAVADKLNATRDPAYAALPGDTTCVCYPTGPYVGCREFYMAQPDDGTPPTSSTWFGVTRCDPACTDPNGCP